MPAEGMVDALRRASALLAPGGCIIDLHPTPELARLALRTAAGHVLELGVRPDTGEPTHPVARHRAADAAIARSVAERMLDLAATVESAFSTYAEAVDELRTHMEAKWNPPRFDDATLERARAALRRERHAVLFVCERLRVSRLVPPHAGREPSGPV